MKLFQTCGVRFHTEEWECPVCSVSSSIIDRFMKEQKKSTAGSGEQVGPAEAVGDWSNSTDKNGQNLTSLTFKEYASLGLPIMMIFLVISSIYITVIYRW